MKVKNRVIILDNNPTNALFENINSVFKSNDDIEYKYFMMVLIMVYLKVVIINRKGKRRYISYLR
ncbi:Uncharacterised protein [Actinobacillus equuli]|nr:Uncharacterised protein [Actinobacillus equuli]